MGEVKLNLARKWRSKQFEEIVGQDLSVRMLKNSLYLQQYFPVYLFSGQRGCGKTTTARVFAASLNCEKLSDFQVDPKSNIIPCLSCSSCKAVESGNHPDFIEIDAASHTGVDNVRMLIDSAALLPLMGRKKIYLIDEAHMLSKAAFNALLKILEEPPASVLFILATTDPQKIIDTVRSRCFQLFFRPVDMEILQTRLRKVCAKEDIPYDDQGLSLIIKQTDGSVRDALNLLEQVRFASKQVTHEAVLQVLGFMDDGALVSLFETVLLKSSKDLLTFIKKLEWQRYSAQIIWVRMLELVRASLWLKYGVQPDMFEEYFSQLHKIVSSVSAAELTYFMQAMYEQELLFAKTNAKHDFLEMVLMQISQKSSGNSPDGGGSPSSQQAPTQKEEEELEEEFEEVEEEEEEYEETRAGQWRQFVNLVAKLDDPLLLSIFKQGKIEESKDGSAICVQFSKDLIFFADMIKETENDWYPIFEKLFGSTAQFEPQFTGAPLKTGTKKVKIEHVKKAETQSVQPAQQPKQAQPDQQQKKQFPQKRFNRAQRQSYKPFAKEVAIDVQDQATWAKTHMILKYFPGKVTEVRD